LFFAENVIKRFCGLPNSFYQEEREKNCIDICIILGLAIIFFSVGLTFFNGYATIATTGGKKLDTNRAKFLLYHKLCLINCHFLAEVYSNKKAAKLISLAAI